MPGLVHIFVGYACLVGLLVQVVVGILKYRILVPWGDELSSVFATCLFFFGDFCWDVCGIFIHFLVLLGFLAVLQQDFVHDCFFSQAVQLLPASK